jgi:hypothetical protein
VPSESAVREIRLDLRIVEPLGDLFPSSHAGPEDGKDFVHVGGVKLILHLHQGVGWSHAFDHAAEGEVHGGPIVGRIAYWVDFDFTVGAVNAARAEGRQR